MIFTRGLNSPLNDAHSSPLAQQSSPGVYVVVICALDLVSFVKAQISIFYTMFIPLGYFAKKRSDGQTLRFCQRSYLSINIYA